MAQRFVLPFADVGSGIKPSSGAKLSFFITGTNTPKDTFTNEALTIANSNPVVADANGLFGDIWMPGGARYKVTLDNASDVQQWEADPVTASAGSQVSDIVALRATEPTFDGEQISLLGHTIPAIGSGVFYFDASDTTTADNNATVIVTAGGARWKRDIEGEVSVEMFGSIPDWDGATGTDNTTTLQAAIDYAIANSSKLKVSGRYMHSGLVAAAPIDGFELSGYTWEDELYNSDTSGGHAIHISSSDQDIRAYGVSIKDLSITGNALSGGGIRADALGWYDISVRFPSPSVFDHLKIEGHGVDGIHLGKSSTEGAGNVIRVSNSLITKNGRTGVVALANTNLVTVIGNTITSNGRDGVESNQVASTNTIQGNLFADNVRYGVYCNRCEEPFIVYNGFNRNLQGAVLLTGDASGSIKYTEAAVVQGNLFGDNGGGSGTPTELTIVACKGTTVHSNYFFGTGQDRMILLGSNAEGVSIRANHFKDLTTEVKLTISGGAVNTYYTFEDFGEDILRSSTTIQDGIGECILQEVITPTSVIDLSGIKSTFALIAAMTQNVTSILFPSDPIDGQRIELRIKQGTSAFTLTGFPANVRLAGGSFTVTAIVGKQDYLAFRYSAGSLQWVETSRSQNLTA